MLLAEPLRQLDLLRFTRLISTHQHQSKVIERQLVAVFRRPSPGLEDRFQTNGSHQTLENQHAGSAASFGFFWGFLIGLIFGGPLFWGLFTALLAGLLGKTTDLGVDNKFIKEVGNSLEPGQSALFMLVISVTPDKVLPEMEKLGGTVFQTSLSQEAEDQLRAALAHEHVNEAAGDALELEQA